MAKNNVLTIVILIVILASVGLVTYYFFTVPNDKANSEASKNLQSSEDAVYTDLEGIPISFEAYEGKVRIVNSWASWTPFSQAELLDLESLAQEYKGKDIAFLAINRKEPKELAKQYLKTIGEFKELTFIIDLTDAYYLKTGGYAMPETLVYDAKGAIVMHRRGAMTKDEMRQYIEQAVAQSR